MSFSELPPLLGDALSERGYEAPTPVQAAVLEDGADGRDLIVSAQTGSGKTVAFGLAMAGDLLGPDGRLPPPAWPLALVIAPTRELALQVSREFIWLYGKAGARIATCVGGMDAAKERRALGQGAQIVVGTPGRLRDHLERGALDLSGLAVAVLDEADEMLDFGFLPDIKWILGNIPNERQMMLFSATMSKEISGIAQSYLTKPATIEVGERNEPTKTVRQMSIHTPEAGKITTVNFLMKETAPRLTLIFCNTRHRVKTVTKKLNAEGLTSACIHGDLSQSQRNSIMRDFRAGKTPVLVATDVAARGIDVDNIDLVINYDVPDKPEYYVHRIGRTGRAGHSGFAATLVSEQDIPRLRVIKKQYNVLMN